MKRGLTPCATTRTLSPFTPVKQIPAKRMPAPEKNFIQSNKTLTKYETLPLKKKIQRLEQRAMSKSPVTPIHRFKHTIETQTTQVSSRKVTSQAQTPRKFTKNNGDLSNFIDCDSQEDLDQIDQKNYNLADLDAKHFAGGGQQQFQTMYNTVTPEKSPEYRNQSLGALRMKILNSSVAETVKHGTVSIVEQASPAMREIQCLQSFELESVKSYGSIQNFQQCEAKYKTEITKPKPVKPDPDDILQETLRQCQFPLSEASSFMGPKIKKVDLSSDGLENTPTKIKNHMEGGLRASQFQMLHSLQSGTKVMSFPETRNQYEQLRSFCESLPNIGTWEEIVAPQFKKYPSEFKTNMQKEAEIEYYKMQNEEQSKQIALLNNLLNMYMKKNGSSQEDFFEFEHNDNSQITICEKTGRFGLVPDSTRDFTLLENIQEEEIEDVKCLLNESPCSNFLNVKEEFSKYKDQLSTKRHNYFEN